MNIQLNFADGESIGQREAQEDAKGNLIINGEYMLYVLADGMGGQVGGALASDKVVRAFVDYFTETPLAENPEDSLRAALVAANDKITAALTKDSALNGMGSTVIALLFHQPTNRYWYLSVGDSPLYLLESQQIRQINAEHSHYVDLLEMVKNGEITQEEADEDPERYSITSAIMGKEIKLIDVGGGVLAMGDLLLLASDGVQTLDDKAAGELEAALSDIGDLTSKVSAIFTALDAKAEPFQDNTTLILVEAVKPERRVTAPIPKSQRGSEASGAGNEARGNNKSDRYSVKSIIPILMMVLVLAGLALYFLKPQQEPQMVSTPCEKTDGSVCDDSTPADSTPADSTPADSTPADSTPADSTPADSTPADSTPADSTPADSTPADSTPADSTPADSTPADSTPVEPKPVESKPVESTVNKKII